MCYRDSNIVERRLLKHLRSLSMVDLAQVRNVRSMLCLGERQKDCPCNFALRAVPSHEAAKSVTSAVMITTTVRAEVVLASYSYSAATVPVHQGQPPQLTQRCAGMVFRFPGVEARDSHYDAGKTNTS